MNQYKYEPHDFRGKVLNYNYCIKCGLIALKNKFTRWSIDKGCNSEDHPDYEKYRRNL